MAARHTARRVRRAGRACVRCGRASFLQTHNYRLYAQIVCHTVDLRSVSGRNVTSWRRYRFGLAVAPVCLALMNFPLVFGFAECSAQVSAQQTSIEYATHFLDRPPTPAELSHVPADARELVVAKVRLVEPLTYFVNRDQSGRPPPLSPDVFFARIEIVAAVQGAASAGNRLDVYFGARIRGRNYKYPPPRWPLSREYFVASYVSPDGKRRLLAFQISEEEFREWGRTRFEVETPM